MAKRKKTNTNQRRNLNRLKLERLKLENIRQQIDIEKEKLNILKTERDRQFNKMVDSIETLEKLGINKNRITETIGFYPQNYILLKERK